ncbi:hypothetical protein HMPREF1210_00982 [Paenisporosarcina sp. HGH0030]|uniref:alpha/beta hydrolase n=1 Tax=Paenisporosarcina sp. HGH0030 TaxID=1078085 RepID=UPI00034E1F66|nr:alpha/beta hydrolase [Paenisporosarcina sp. HGH0030]EPD53251.1 hypothetical protein HMPREF1210_00982 [Paenisporosarcina sp. HGH0030]
MTKSIHYVKMSDGHEVYTVVYKPQNPPIGHIHILHGMAEHIGRYEEFAQFLVTKGYVVSGHDHRGHGFTGQKNNQKGFFAEKDGFDRVTEDVREVLQDVRKDFTCESPILFAHSMGSFIGRRYIQKYGHSISKIVLSGTGGPAGFSGKVGKLIAKGFARVKGTQIENPLLNKLTFGKFNKGVIDAKTEFDWLSTDSVEVQKYIDDPYCGFVASNQFFVDLITGINKIHEMKGMDDIPKQLPILMISGALDPVSQNGNQLWEVAEKYKKAGLTDITVVLIEGKRHELLNEINKEETFELIINWMEKK